MLTFNTFKLIIMTITFAFILSGCTTTYSGPSPDRTQAPTPTKQIERQEPAPKSPPPEQAEQEITEAPQKTSKVSIFKRREPPESREVKVDYADIEFARLRMKIYENKYEQWLEISEVDQEGELLEEFIALGPECVQKLERILTGYNLLLDRMQQSDTVTFDKIATIDPKWMQQLDITFLESRCNELLTMEIPTQYEFIPEAIPELSFSEVQKNIISDAEQGNYREVISAYDNLAQKFPEQKPFLSTRLNYGLALQYSGQIEAAARHFNTMLVSGDLSIEPLSLQREIADLLLASGNVAAAESHYDSIILAHDSIGSEKIWAEEQLVFLRSVDPESEEMIAYMKFLREFQMYDYKVYAPELNEAIEAFAAEYADSPVAASALRLKTFAVNQLKSWFDRQLVKIDYLVAEKKFTEAADILRNMTRYYLPAELQALVQKTYYEVAQAEIQEDETQRRIQEMELTEQWSAAVNLLDSQQYDFAISAFEALMGTEYEEKAQMKIIEAANQAASQMRKEAASLFIRAGKTPDLDQKKELLLASHRLLTEILTKYPQTDLLDKVEQNIAILEVQIQRFDPALLEELHQRDSAELPAEQPDPFTRQLQ
jgi:tetratricopeptide (TPR) repeat protein